jgi:hypothetical protein
MNYFEYTQTLETIPEKMAALILAATKEAYKMAGINFDELTEAEKMEAACKTYDILYK